MLNVGNLAGYLPIEQPKTPDLEKHKLLEELDILVDRVTADTSLEPLRSIFWNMNR